MNAEKDVRKLVSYFHSPIRTGPKPAVQVLEDLARRLCCFPPCGFAVGQYFSDIVRFKFAVVNVEKIPRHRGQRTKLCLVPDIAVSLEITQARLGSRSEMACGTFQFCPTSGLLDRGRPMARRWTEEDIEDLKRMAKRYQLPEIAEKLDRTVGGVAFKAHTLKLLLRPVGLGAASGNVLRVRGPAPR
jgi:hypothetical protein